MAERILVIDDDLDTLRLVGLMLQRQGYEIIAASNGTQGLEKAFAEKPNLILLDVMMPDMDGYEVTRRLRKNPTTSTIPILMFTAKTQIDDKVTGFEVGADDYLTKPFNPLEVVARTKAILRRARGNLQPPHILEQGRLRLDLDQHLLTLNGVPIVLTRTEFALLSALMSAPNYAFTREELVEKALGYSYEGLERSLDSHIKNLRKKIGDDPADPHFIETVFGVGYRFRGETA